MEADFDIFPKKIEFFSTMTSKNYNKMFQKSKEKYDFLTIPNSMIKKIIL
jgi:hypothetical protein